MKRRHKALKGMSIQELANKRWCRECGKDLEPFNKSLCNDCLTKELIFMKREFKRLVYEKFGGKCFYCGISERKCLTVHHLEPFNPNRFDIDRVVLVCRNCHSLLNDTQIHRVLSNGKSLVI